MKNNWEKELEYVNYKLPPKAWKIFISNLLAQEQEKWLKGKIFAYDILEINEELKIPKVIIDKIRQEERKQLLNQFEEILNDIQRSEWRRNIGGEFYNKTEVDKIIDNFRDKLKNLTQ